jgi:hypothetical protein
MKDLEIDGRDIFIDKQSGRDFQREQYQLLKSSAPRRYFVYTFIRQVR